jgi:hypothetical protein
MNVPSSEYSGESSFEVTMAQIEIRRDDPLMAKVFIGKKF